MAGIDHEEKRQFQRMQLSSQLQFRRVDDNRRYKGETLDLSATGIRFVCSEVLISGEFLQIVISSQHPQISPLVAEGQVVRAEPIQDGTNNYNVSVRFTDVN